MNSPEDPNVGAQWNGPTLGGAVGQYAGNTIGGAALAKRIDPPTLRAQLVNRIEDQKASIAKMEAAVEALDANPAIEAIMGGLRALQGGNW